MAPEFETNLRFLILAHPAAVGWISCLILAATLWHSRRQVREGRQESLRLSTLLRRERNLVADTQARTAAARENSITQAHNQLQAVAAHGFFRKQKIFNHEEYPVFCLIRGLLADPAFKNWHVHGQVCLGEIITTGPATTAGSSAERAYRSINSKRADMVIIDNFGDPAVLVEYHGGGHWGRDPEKARQKDEIKRIAAEKAGIAYVALYPNMDEARRTQLILVALHRHHGKRSIYAREFA
jgi:hypothetical protein